MAALTLGLFTKELIASSRFFPTRTGGVPHLRIHDIREKSEAKTSLLIAQMNTHQSTKGETIKTRYLNS